MAGISFEKTRIPGLLIINPRRSHDARGSFIKTFTADAFAEQGLSTNFAEEFLTSSKRGVVRGMHLQLPPSAHDKIVFCMSGRVFDVVLDLRVGSPTFGQAEGYEMAGSEDFGLYIPVGCAHGFCAHEDDSVLSYKVTTGHAPLADSGVLWSSTPIEWPVEDPIISARDAALPTLAEFDSPFVFDGDPA